MRRSYIARRSSVGIGSSHDDSDDTALGELRGYPARFRLRSPRTQGPAYRRAIRASVTQRGATSPLTQRDVISPKIDVFAQRAIFRMLKGRPAANLAAQSMVYAVKTSKLAGIYKEDQRVPALRARSLGRGWWQLIPKGQDALCLKQPTSSPPILVFRDSVRSNRLRLDPALQQAWMTCGPRIQQPPPYVPAAGAPSPQPQPPSGPGNFPFARICHSPAQVELVVTQGDTTMKGRTVTIRNCGSGVINWQASSDVEWLILNKYAGASTGKPENVAVFIKAADLAPGKHVGRVLFAAPGSWNSPQALTVTVFVQRPSPTIGPGSRPAGNLCLGGGIFCATLKFMRDKGGKYLILSPKDRETAIQMENNALIRRCAHRAPVGAEARVKWRTKMRQQAAKRVDAVRLGSPRGGPECG